MSFKYLYHFNFNSLYVAYLFFKFTNILNVGKKKLAYHLPYMSFKYSLNKFKCVNRF